MTEQEQEQKPNWYKRNENTIRWATMISAWVAGVACILTGIGIAPGLAIIGAGSAYGASKSFLNAIKRSPEEDVK